MFFALLEDVITSNVECCFVVTIKSHKDILDDAKVPEKPLKQNEFTCGRGQWNSI